MSPEDLRAKIQAAALKFTNEVIAVFGQAFTSVAAELAVTPTAPVAPAAPAKAPARRKRAQAKKAKPAPAKAPKPVAVPKAPKPAKPAPAKKLPDKRGRRSSDQIKKAGEGVVKLLTANKAKGWRVEQINKELGTTTRDLMRPISKLLAEGKIRKQGERRATTYFAV